MHSIPDTHSYKRTVSVEDKQGVGGGQVERNARLVGCSDDFRQLVRENLQ